MPSLHPAFTPPLSPFRLNAVKTSSRPTPRRLRFRTPPTAVQSKNKSALTHSPSSPPSPTPPPTPPPPPPPTTLSPLFISVAALSALSLSALFALFDNPSSIPQTLEMPSQQTFLSIFNDFIYGPHFAVSLGMGFSAFIQALTGFGFAIVSVGALTQVPWIAHSTIFNSVQPVAATLGALTGWLLVLPEIEKVKWKDISILLIASSLTTPFGAVLLEYFDVNVVIRMLGALISGYVLYSVLGIKVPKLMGKKAGAWGLGFLAGALGGAFDITGPPLVVHGEAAGWPSENGEFRRNILTVVSINSSLVVLWDWYTGRLNDFYYWDFVKCALPTTIVGIIAGKILADRMDPASFKKVVLGTCMVMGVKLLFS